jgi:A/G-specific adenine glycosylase
MRVPALTDFAERVLTWFDGHGRKDLPWQEPIDAYRVWVSEIMLQQTQVQTVVPYFERFMQSFPDVLALADAAQDDVLRHWSGLGYYARARNLHRAAGIVRDEHGGAFPETLEAVMALPGIGRSTAGAILSIAFGQRHAILDGNVKRVLARHSGIAGWPGLTSVAKELWAIAERNTPDTRVADYTQAIMDLGATLCTRSNPACERCPVATDCETRTMGTVTLIPGFRDANRRRTSRCARRRWCSQVLMGTCISSAVPRRASGVVYGACPRSTARLSRTGAASGWRARCRRRSPGTRCATASVITISTSGRLSCASRRL